MSTSSRVLRILAAGFLLLGARAVHADESLVNCSEKRFHSGNSVRSLMGWSDRQFKIAQKAKTNGDIPPSRVCDKLISLRGDAHCQQPSNATIRVALSGAQALCDAFAKQEPPKKAPTATVTQPAAATGQAIVDCSLPRFQSRNSARTLMGFSDRIYSDVQAAEGTGIYPKNKCDELISKRGTAHCKKPENASYRQKLTAADNLCRKLKNPAKTTKKMLVDCKQKRFQEKRSVPVLLSWSRSAVSDLSEWSGIQAGAKCKRAYSHAGSAHCLLPAKEAPRAELRRIAQTCAQDQERRAARVIATAAAEVADIARAKANRKIVKMPRGRGGTIARQMHRAMLASRTAKSKSELLKVQVMTGWQSGRFVDTKIPYKKITGMVLWHDGDNDGVCRFTSYNFMKTKQGGGWGKLAFRSFCNGCAEGWTRCPKKRKK